MLAQPCPSCARLVQFPDEPGDGLALCPVCGFCFADGRAWARSSDDPELLPTPPAPRSTRTLVGLIFAGLVIGSWFAGRAFLFGAAADRYFNLIAAFMSPLLLLGAAVLIRAARRQAPPRLDAETLRLPADLPLEVFDLGAPQAVYPSAGTGTAVSILVMGLVMAGLGAVAITAVLNGHTDHRMPELALVAPLAAVSACFMGLRNIFWRMDVLVCADALVRIVRGHASVFRWDDIEAVYRNIDEVYRHRCRSSCTVRCRSGASLKFTGNRLERADQLAELIERETARRMLPEAERQLDAGGSVTFGPLTVGSAGLTKGSATLPWDEIADVQVVKGVLTARQRGRRRAWCAVGVSKVPNVAVLLGLVERRAAVLD
jgi:hypothetical protein